MELIPEHFYPAAKTLRMKSTTSIVLLLVGLTLFLFGCHYRVTNPESGRTYYTTNYKDYKQTGAIRFKDHRTGNTVTLSSWETKQIPKGEYEQEIAEGQ